MGLLRGPLRLRLGDFPGSEGLAARIRAEGIVLAGPGEEADLLAGPARPSAAQDPPRLPPREVEILGYLADGWSNAEIASVLGIGVRTVRFHLAKLYESLGVSRRGEAVREALKAGIIKMEF